MKRPSLAVGWLGLMALSAILGPWLLSEQASRMDLTQALEAPSAAHWLGTDSLGRDLLLRLVCGAGTSLGVAAFAVLIATVFGTLLGALAAYSGGWRDKLLMSFTDLMLAFPTFFLLLSVIAMLGPGTANLVIIIGLTSWMGTARLVRAEVLSLKQREFVLAARSIGAGHARILFRHLIPNALSPVIVSAVLGLASAILVESGLSFLGIGVQPPAPSWGNILTDGKGTLGVAWWMLLFPGAAIFLTVLSAHVIGERLQEWMDGGRGGSHEHR